MYKTPSYYISDNIKPYKQLAILQYYQVLSQLLLRDRLLLLFLMYTQSAAGRGRGREERKREREGEKVSKLVYMYV